MTNIIANGLSVRLGSLQLKNPIIACSGTFSSGIEYNDLYDVSLLGAVTTKSFSLEPRLGNKPPRLCETPAGLLNSIGLQNEGIDFFINEHLPVVKKFGFTVILSILGVSVSEFIEIAVKIRKIENDIAAVELNLSCPNIEKGGITMGAVPQEVEKATAAVRKILNIPVVVKLSPNNNNLSELALSAKNGGAEAVSLINTVIGMAIDINTFKPKLGNVTGGLSGPAIRPIAVAKIYSLHKEKILPIIGMGGVFDYKDAIEFMIAGASAVGLGTVNFIDYDAGKNIIEGLTSYMGSNNIKNISEIIGSVKAG